MDDLKYCYACNNKLPYKNLRQYVQCPSCHSYVYISDKSAEEENKLYFDLIFQTLGGRKDHKHKRILFEKFVRLDHKKRKKQYALFYKKREQILKHLKAPAKVLEIGFGSGEHLFCMLQQGVDAFGIDLSETAVRNFQDKYPEYANRVQRGTRFNKQVDVIYCCALFEHLDLPEQFIQDASQCLAPKGVLVLDALPLLNEYISNVSTEEDISFWKPCHRAIYSLGGLNLLLEKQGFENEITALHDDFYYRILSVHIKHGVRKIIELRSSAFKHDDLPGYLVYLYLCWKALRVHSLALHGCVLFRKRSL
jgi:SAM-dependent methyltransferase